METTVLDNSADDVVNLCVVIVNYKTPHFVIDCLGTLLPELEGLNAAVVIVDNNSGDDSCLRVGAWLADHDTERKVRLIPSARNSGFAGGNNTGIAAVRACHYLLLNSDTLVRPGAIRSILATAIRYPEAGLVSPRLEWPDGKGQESCFRFHSPFSELLGAAHTGMIDRLLRRYIVYLPVQEAVAWPEWTSFACVLIKDEVFQQVGLLDEGYFMYFEDVEFCHRAGQAGWRIVHDPDARVVHLRGGSSPVKEQTRLKKRVPRYYYESRTRFFYQAYGWWGLTAANLMWWLGRSVSKARQWLGRSDKTAVERQWLDIWTHWLDPMKPCTPPK